ncbi:F-box-like protein [Ceratobasidium sp. AG-Ba]|nr:F-box-like protein [Ceratobasidium sp. AG-Ba]
MPVYQDALLPEIFHHVFGTLSISDLTKLSLVCRKWQALAFPHLHSNVYLGCASHLENFAHRILATSDSSSIVSQVRGLVIDAGPRQKYYNYDERFMISEQHMKTLRKLVENLPDLEYFSWELKFLHGSVSVMKTLRANCPNIRSLRCLVPRSEEGEGSWFEEEFYLEMFRFTGIFHFSWEIEATFDNESSLLDRLAHSLRACPDLKTLEFSCGGFDDESRWSTEDFWSKLRDVTFRSLRTFRAVGSNIAPDWSLFLDSPDKSALRAFFLRHPNLRSIGFGPISPTDCERFLQTTDVETLFPGLTEFEGPIFLCRLLVGSTLADQIESLTITDDVHDLNTGAIDLSPVARMAKRMPRLRRLVINIWSTHSDGLSGLDELLQCTPSLKELKLVVKFTELDEIVDLLPHVPCLRGLSIYFPSIMELITGESGWNECLPVMAKACPQLQYVCEVAAWEETGYWWIVRGRGGEISVVPDGIRQP